MINTQALCNKLFLIFKLPEIRFDDYQQYLRYTYNQAHECGRIVEIIETVKNQPRHIPFDFEFNTVEGKKREAIFVFPYIFIIQENEHCFSLVGAILFGIHSEDLSDELIDLVLELNKSKVPLWKQMRIIEIVAAELADRLGEGGTKFEMEPDRVVWPDGTITKKNAPSTRSKKTKKVPPAVSKHGLYGVIVAQCSNAKKKSAPSTASEASASMPPSSVIVERADTETPMASAAPKAKQVRRGT